MQTLVMDMKAGEDRALMEKAGEILRQGGLVAFPTETVYGLGADALDPRASRKIYAAKGRPSDNPLIVHIASMDALDRIAANIPKEAELLAEAFWPGPLTMIFRKTEAVPRETTGGLDTVAVRMPNHPLALSLIECSGGYIAAPSANTSGRPSPTNADHVLRDLDGKIDAVIDGGPVNIGLESTIVDLTEDMPVILRPGYINRDMLERVLGAVKIDPGLISEDSHIRPKAPGMKYRHYAPKASMIIVEGEDEAVTARILELCREDEAKGMTCGVLTTWDKAEAYRGYKVLPVGLRQDELSIARNLYDALRRFDQWGVDRIYSEAFATPMLGGAIMNRLVKAAGHQIIQV